ncbi:MAG: hypothetical protein R2799_02865 [Crocinitomicaceae bacterium]
MKYLAIIILLVLVSCKKHFEEEQTIVFRAMNPATDFRVQGVKVTIYENYHKKNLVLGSQEQPCKSKIIYEGVTNSMGECEFTFLPLRMNQKNYEVKYRVDFDCSNIIVPYNDFIIQNPTSGYLYGGQIYFPSTYQEMILRITPKVNVVRHVKNVNCQGSNDTVRYSYWSSYPYSSFTQNSGTWGYGCIDDVSYSSGLPQDSIFWEAMIIRNGITTYIQDSMLLDPSKTQDTIKIYY